MAGYQVDPNDVKAVAGQMASANDEINAQMNQLMNQLSSLPGLWQGPAAASFFSAKQRWDSVARQHNQRLAEISTVLGQTHTNYVTNEEASQQSLNRFDGVLNP
ncbi:MAG: WXG100 family type VII secretion target [Actinomycetota bacterium]|nr:WXG100 family type VII secretion target [Actinomycetota bacterium]